MSDRTAEPMLTRGAVLSPWERDGQLALWVMLNPSTAIGQAVLSPCGKYRYRLVRNVLRPLEEDRNDNTIRAVTRITKAWGYAEFMVGNIYALRSRDPAGLWRVDDPVGPENLYHLRCMAGVAHRIVAAWGAHADRADAEPIADMLATYGDVWCLGLNKNGSPKHPLFIRTDCERVLFAPHRRAA